MKLIFVDYIIILYLFLKAGENRSLTGIEDIDIMLLECANKYGVTDAKLQAALEGEDVTLVNACFWTCCFKKVGFLDARGKYVADPGLTYGTKMVRSDDVHTDLEHVARQCASAIDLFVSNGEGGCRRGALIAACFFEQLDQIYMDG